MLPTDAHVKEVKFLEEIHICWFWQLPPKNIGFLFGETPTSSQAAQQRSIPELKRVPTAAGVGRSR